MQANDFESVVSKMVAIHFVSATKHMKLPYVFINRLIFEDKTFDAANLGE